MPPATLVQHGTTVILSKILLSPPDEPFSAVSTRSLPSDDQLAGVLIALIFVRAGIK